MNARDDRPSRPAPADDDAHLTWAFEGGAGVEAPTPRRRRWPVHLAAAGIALLVLFGAWRALRGDRTYRAIQRDIQHVVALEADAQAAGDRELYLNLQDAGRRRALRRPDLPLDGGASTGGPYPGLAFAAGAPEVVRVVAAETSADKSVQAVTATLRAAATDGGRIGRFTQDRRMVRGADGAWRHADAPGVPRELAAGRAFSRGLIEAEFPPEDETILAPILAAAADAADDYCALVHRCAGRVARLRFAVRHPGEHETTALPAPSRGWRPEDEAARELVGFAVTREALFSLDGGVGGDGEYGAVGEGLVDAWLARRAAPEVLAGWLADKAAERDEWTLQHLIGRIAMPSTASRSRLAAARGFAAYVDALGPSRVAALLSAWSRDSAPSPARESDGVAPLDTAFGERALAVELDWPSRQDKVPPGVAAGVVGCFVPFNRWSSSYVLAPGADVARAESLACGVDQHLDELVWSPSGERLAAVCLAFDPLAVDQGKGHVVVASADAGSPDGWRVGRTGELNVSASATHLAWSPNGRSVAWRTDAPLDDPATAAERTIRAEVWVMAVPDGLPDDVPAPRRLAAGPPHVDSGVRGGGFSQGASIAWSADGRAIAADGPDGLIVHRLDATDGAPGQRLPGFAFAWAPADGRIAVLGARANSGRTAGDATETTAGTGEGGESAYEHVLTIVDGVTGAARNTLALDAAAFRTAFAGRAEGEVFSRDAARVGFATAPTWSSDARWVATTLTATDARCGDASDCRAVLAWEPETGALRAALNKPQPNGAYGWQWSASWIPGTHRVALHSLGSFDLRGLSPIEGDAMHAAADKRRPGSIDPDPTIAFVLDTDADAVEAVPRSRGASLGTVLPDFSPDGRWHTRLDASWRLIVEPADRIGGYRANDPSSGWRFNRSGCIPYVQWAGRR